MIPPHFTWTSISQVIIISGLFMYSVIWDDVRFVDIGGHCWPSLFTLSFHSTITFVLAISLNKKLKLQIFLLTHVQNFEYETNEYIKYKLFKRVVNSTITTIHYFVECQKWIHQFILILVYYLLLKHINNQISLNDWDYIFV